jgi:hypothetical protein
VSRVGYVEVTVASSLPPLKADTRPVSVASVTKRSGGRSDTIYATAWQRSGQLQKAVKGIRLIRLL